MNSAAPASALQKLPPSRIVRGFLGEELVERLLSYADSRRADFTPTQVGSGETGRQDPAVRISHLLRDLGPLRAEVEARFESVRDRTMEELRMAPVSFKSMELELVAHGDGAFYKRHIDTFTGVPSGRKSDRVLTGVSYFHALPKRFTGGEIRLYSFLPSPQGEDSFIDIEPERDLLLLFPSWAPHEVRPVSCPSGEFLASRFAINCWYRREHSPPNKPSGRQAALEP